MCAVRLKMISSLKSAADKLRTTPVVIVSALVAAGKVRLGLRGCGNAATLYVLVKVISPVWESTTVVTTELLLRSADDV